MMAAAYGRSRVPAHVWSGERSMSWRRLSPAGKAGQGAEARFGTENFRICVVHVRQKRLEASPSLSLAAWNQMSASLELDQRP